MKAKVNVAHVEKKGRIGKPLFKLVLVIGLAGVVLSVGMMGVRRFFTSSYFYVDEIRWRGLHRVNQQALDEQFQSVLGQSLIDLDIDDMHADLMGNRWVKEVVIRKILPNKVDVLITERIPAAIEIDPKSKQLVLRDQEGVILEEGTKNQVGLPKMIHYEPNAYKNALILAPLLAKRSDALINLSDADNIRVQLGGGVLHFGDHDFQKRWERFLRVEGDMKRRQLVSWETDLRFPSKIVARRGHDQ